MRHGGLALALAAIVAGGAQAQPPAAPDQQGYVAYHECMMLAAMRASQTPVRDEEVFGLAKARCAATRAQVMVGQARNKAFLAALDDADAEQAADFPEWIHGVRARGEAARLIGTASGGGDQ